MTFLALKYCTYITLYRGNKLPPFYIGYSITKKVEEGYRGSVSSREYSDIWYAEQNQNPQLFKTKILTTHATREAAKTKETYFQLAFRVHRNPMYVNKHIQGIHFYPTEESIKKLSILNKGRKHTSEHITKNSLAHKGLLFWNDGIINKRSKISPGPNWQKGKLLSDQAKSLNSKKDKEKQFWNNGTIHVRVYKIPGEGWTRGMISHGKKWWTNGNEIIMSKESPGENWYPGNPKASESLRLRNIQRTGEKHPDYSEKMKGKLWWTNGVLNKRSKISPGIQWFRGRTIHPR
jgi:hypothetical protein